MRLSDRDWRTIACYRGVGAVKNQRELNPCLREQMTSRERTDYHSGVVVGVLAAIAAFAFCVWHGRPDVCSGNERDHRRDAGRASRVEERRQQPQEETVVAIESPCVTPGQKGTARV